MAFSEPMVAEVEELVVEAPPIEKPPERGWRSSILHWHFLLLLAVIIFFGAIRWRLLDIPLERDEGEYAYSGQLILEGIPPFKLASNMKLPGTDIAYAGIMAVFGQTTRGIHIGFLLVNALSTLLIYLLASRLFGTLAGLAAGASYASLSTHQGVLGFAAHATHFVVLASLLGLLLLFKAIETRRFDLAFWSGLAFGVAFLMKQPGILLGVFAFLYLAVECWPKDRDWSGCAKRLSLFLLGGILPFGLTCLFLYRAGVFANFWLWTFEYAREYGRLQSLRKGLEPLRINATYMLYFTRWLWILVLAGLLAPLWDARARRYAFFLFGLLVFSVAAVCPGFFFRHHYFVLMLPASAILIGVAVASTTNLLTTKVGTSWVRAIPLIVFAAAFTFSIYRNREYYFQLTPVQACQLLYAPHPFLEAPSIAEYLREHTTPADKIMVFGSEPEIYFYAHRHSASSYIYMYSLMEDQPLWPVMQKQMMQEVEANPPEYVVFVSSPYSWFYRSDSEQANALIPWMRQYLSSSFDKVGVIEHASPEPRYFWGEAASTANPSGYPIFVFKRKG